MKRNSNKLSIGEAAKMLGVSLQTLRRWDTNGFFRAQRNGNKKHRYYQKDDVEYFLQINVGNYVEKWALAKKAEEPHPLFYCSNSAVFQTRLMRLQDELMKVRLWQQEVPLLVAIAGEIGNNSFDHNLGNWPDIPGVFFGYNLEARTIVLADRGQGLLKTLQRVRPKIKDHHDALYTAFTEIISGRAPENRGNGLKFVVQAVINGPFGLFFQSGDAMLILLPRDEGLNIEKQKTFVQGSLATLKF